MKKSELNRVLLASAALILMTATSCKKDDTTEVPTNNNPTTHQTTPYVFDIPDYFPFFSVPEDNPTTIEGVALGRRIYYDKMLSVGGPLEGKACASCHQQKYSFTSPGTGTQVMSHVNLRYADHFLWNGAKEGTLEDVAMFEVTEFFQADVSLFQNDPTYKEMMYKAFGVTQFSAKHMAYALAQWLRTINSSNSKFDRCWQGETDILSPLEEMGYLIFNSEKGDCFHCHSFPLMSDYAFHNIGLDSSFSGENAGRYNVTSDPADYGKFKTPTLRNVELTAPYMHDGRFQTLEEVIEHYNSGVKSSESLDAIMTKPGKEHGLNLSDVDKAALVAFLKTLTDTSIVNDPNHSSPF